MEENFVAGVGVVAVGSVLDVFAGDGEESLSDVKSGMMDATYVM